VSATDQVKPRRRPAAEFPSITGLRLSPYGAKAALVDISTTGLLAECSVRLKVGSPVQVLFEGGFAQNPAAGRVARCEVAAMGRDGVLRYHAAVAFDAPIVIDELATAPTIEPAAEPIPLIPTYQPASRFIARNRW
jgi:hypothetical protein